jgi:hypothetical protein
MRKVKDTITLLAGVVEGSRFPEPPEKTLERNLFRLDEIKRKVFDALDVKFIKLQEAIKRKVGQSQHVYREYE